MPINKLSAAEFIAMGEQYTTLHTDTLTSLSAEAVAAWTYLSTKPPGWKVRVEEVRAHYGWGDFTWRKVSKELRERGLLTSEALRGSRGKIVAREITIHSISPGAAPKRGKSTVMTSHADDNQRLAINGEADQRLNTNGEEAKDCRPASPLPGNADVEPRLYLDCKDPVRQERDSYKTPPTPPRGDLVELKPKPKAKPKAHAPIPDTVPDSLNRDALDLWLQYKLERGQVYTATGLKSLITQMSKRPPDAQEEAVEVATSNTWQGIHWPRVTQQPQPTMSREQLASRMSLLNRMNPKARARA
jgi:hypothetical protein